MSAESDSLSSPDRDPTRELLLAQALETCIQAERLVPGSADQIIARQPAWARGELRRLVSLANSLDAAATSAIISEDFRARARTRLMRRIAPEQFAASEDSLGAYSSVGVDDAWPSELPSRNGHLPARGRSRWVWRGSIGGLLAAALVAAATLTASATALPGEPLYGVKQVREEIGVRLAPSDDARALAWLGEANARLDETAQLLRQGRMDRVTQTTQEYDDALNRATVTYVVTIADAPPTDPTSNTMQSTLNQQQQQLQNLLDSAPEPARADLREALVATQRSQAMMAEPKPVDRRGEHASTAAAQPATAVEVEPTSVETASSPPPVDIVAQPQPPVADTSDRHEGRAGSGGAQVRSDAPTAVVARSGGPSVSARSVTAPAARRQAAPAEDVQVMPAPAEAGEDTGAVEVAPPRVEHADAPAVDTRSARGDDHVMAPSQNQDNTHERVAEQPAPTAPVAQRPSDSDTRSQAALPQAPAPTPTPAPPTVAQTSAGASAHAASRDGGGGGDSSHDGVPVAPQTARAPTATPAPSTSARPDDKHGGGTNQGTQGGGGATPASHSGGSVNQTNQGGGNSGGGGHDGTGHGSD